MSIEQGGTKKVDFLTTPAPVTGSLTNNNAAPTSNNLGVLAALANAVTPTWTEGNQTLLSVDLNGRLRIQGTGATASVVPGVAMYVGGLNGSGNLEGIRTAAQALNTTTGIFAAGMVACFDDTSPQAISENQFGSVRMSSRREVYSQLRDAAGNERGANVTANNGLQVALTAPAALTPSAPATASVTTTDSTVVASAATRKGIQITNISGGWVYLAFGTTSALSSGIALAPYGGSWEMGDRYTYTGAINAISNVGSTLAIQEWT